MRRLVAVVTALTLLALAGCSWFRKPADDAQAGDRYGVAPVEKPEGITYQPDVVIIRGGQKAVRHVSANGLTWTLDKNAPGIADLQPGKVMYASSMALGRVMRIDPVGDGVAVLLAPISLTDLIKDGRLSFDEELSMDDISVQEVPEAPAIYTDMSQEPDPSPSAKPEPTGASPTESTEPEATESPESTERTGSRVANGDPGPQVMTAALGSGGKQPQPIAAPAVQQQTGGLPPPTSCKAKFTAGKMEYELWCRNSDKQKEIGVTIMKNRRSQAGANAGLKGGVTIRLAFENLRAKADVPISNGRIQNENVAFNGLKQMAMDFEMGSAEGLADNMSDRVEIPWTVRIPNPSGLGIHWSLKFKFILQFGFSSKNTTMKGSVIYAVGGALGTSQNATATAVGNPASSFSGVSLAPFGIVVAFEVKTMMGIGLPGLNAGPFVKLVMSVGYVNSGEMGLVACRSVNVSGNFQVGAGLDVSEKAATYLGDLFKRLAPGQKFNVEAEATAANFKAWEPKLWAIPDSAFCRNET